MYARFPGGWRNPGGIIVPVDVEHEVLDSRGGLMGAYVRLSDEKGIYSWTQYVKKDQLLNDDEVEDE